MTDQWLQCTFNWIHQVNSKLIWFQLPKHAHEKGHDITPLLVPFFDNSQSSRGRSANPTIIWPPSLPCPLLTTTDWRSRFLKRSEKIPAFLWVFPSHSISQLLSLEIKCLICPIQSSDTSIKQADKTIGNGILFPKLFCENFKSLSRSPEQFIKTVKGKNNFWNRIFFLTCSWRVLRSNTYIRKIGIQLWKNDWDFET